MEHPISISELGPAAAKVCGPKVPAAIKMMAADGLAPLGPKDLVSALYALTYDTDEKVARKALTTLERLPDNILLGAVDTIENGGVLDGLARRCASRLEALQRILLRSASLGETAAFLASTVDDEKTLEIIASNEQRMLAHPAIIEALYHNKKARMSTVDRAVELAVRNGIELFGIPCFEEVKRALSGELIPEPTDEPTPDDTFFRENVDDALAKDIDESAVDLALLSEDEVGQEELKKRKAEERLDESAAQKVQSIEQSLSRLTTSAKIRVATLGNSSQRAVLIRDSNKLVAMAVVRSPGLKDSEVMLYSRYRSLPEEAIRYIASNREWTKHYRVKLNLVQNPRCPLEFALRFLLHLRTNDIRSLERDKNIPQAIAKAAKQLRTKRSG